MINELRVNSSLWKYLDDTTISETIKGLKSDMQNYLDEMKSWSDDNKMIVNPMKNKRK